MPEMTFTSRWPDGHELVSYSPSLVVHDHLEAGGRYPVAEFVARSRTALETASERVRARYGVPCSRAAASLAAIEARAAGLDGDVEVTALRPERAA
ncbi:MSMEG_0570 family protein [Friedmanniella luteola]|uniref:MSMEG_0570 family protein n=2 Tax=Friedmanniella luteola TaxID=546871 RepID=A0A1H1XWX0_9ACTN|nr:MSMEG_0570 family protein [Friedmanniella luteola]